jgi:hypothetical protein
VDVVRYDGPPLLQPTLQDVLRRLTEDEKVPGDEIAVLTARSLSKNSLIDSSVLEGPRMTDTWPPPPDQIYCTTIYDFKGLERAVVVLVDVHKWPREWDEMVKLLYVGCSRARNHLIVLLPQNAPRKIERAFATPIDRSTRRPRQD